MTTGTKTTSNSNNPLNFVFNWFNKNRNQIIRPLIGVFIFLAIWQLLCSGENPNLPSPITTVKESWNLIINPFFDNGGHR